MAVSPVLIFRALQATARCYEQFDSSLHYQATILTLLLQNGNRPSDPRISSFDARHPFTISISLSQPPSNNTLHDSFNNEFAASFFTSILAISTGSDSVTAF